MPQIRTIKENASGSCYDERGNKLPLHQFRGCKVSWARKFKGKILFKLQDRRGILSLTPRNYEEAITRELLVR